MSAAFRVSEMNATSVDAFSESRQHGGAKMSHVWHGGHCSSLIGRLSILDWSHDPTGPRLKLGANRALRD